ncbi:GNAT family N-acetyltransferase [Acidaminobacter sp. JC074]|uniref:GNAT family N-acetyltransferase n=1 Tax=Acidaminobacter sp. JC074 TaxID=2530199 RepID=UPI001F10812C|nr:GNAT family N-acetyltransferase [Acidaminobacter sp. JC074]MCH4886237.1 GNAT family N-acetyltransferase [Acidaminobacter sp. JC074]
MTKQYKLSDGRMIDIRLISKEDSISDLTSLVNKSYKLLADMGLNYLAATQGDEITLKRSQKAYKCFIGICEDQMIATLSLYAPKPSDKSGWYNRDFVAKVGQFAVLPQYQKLGIGSMMMDLAEVEAGQIEGVTEVALDTAETAYHLIKMYEKRGYKYIETVDWDITNYKSIIMSKRLKVV